jgi:ferredoxin
MSLESFIVKIATTGTEVEVTQNQSILEALEATGLDVPNSCRIGICGTCESKVLSGVPEHLDDLLSDDEHESNATMLICVSRSLSPVLELEVDF